MTIDKGQTNTRERALSSDLNRQVELGNRAIVEALSASASGMSRESGVFGDTSFLVTPMNGTMKSAISPGIAIYYDASKVFPQSTMVWIESRVIREVTHPAADALARWDVVEMRPGEQVSSTQARDQFDSLTGTFTVVNMVKEIQSWPEFQIRSGTPSASPGIPAGVAGWIPLAYVYVAGAAVAVDQTKVVYCRPILSNRQIDREGWTTSALVAAYARDVKGGGVAFNGGSLAGTIVNSLSGRFGATALGQYHHNFRITKTTSVRVTTMTYDGGGLPAADQVLYFYAIPPPYPAGYDGSLAGRELWTPDTANLYGVNGGFYDAGLQNGCIIISSTKEPDVTHPAGPSTGVGSFAHEFFADAGNASSFATSWVYIGAAFYAAATNEVILQKCVDHTVATAVKPGKSFLADLPVASTAYNVWSQPVGAVSHVQWPITARDMDVQIRVQLAAAANAQLHVSDEFGLGGISQGTFNNSFYNGNAAAQQVGGIFSVTTSSTGNITIENATVSAVGINADVYGKCYRDAILKIR